MRREVGLKVQLKRATADLIATNVHVETHIDVLVAGGDLGAGPQAPPVAAFGRFPPPRSPCCTSAG